MQVQTVLGPVAPKDLGVTLPHEHLFIDASCIWIDPSGPSWSGPLLAGTTGGVPLETLAHAPVTIELLGDLLRAPHLSLDNLQVSDPALIAAEVSQFAALGGGTIVDLTNTGLGRNPLGLREIARRTGLHIVMGCGYYVEAGHPPHVATADESTLADEMLRDIVDGVAGTGIRAGIIGEVGTGHPMRPAEAKVLRAAAQAQRATGVALNIHVSMQSGLEALDLALASGVEPTRIVVSHVDSFSNMPYLLETAARGAWLEFDNFGAAWWLGTRAFSDDGTRIDNLLELMDRGYLGQLLISHDVGTKIQLTSFGGFGYAYLTRYIEPMLRDRGVSADEIATLRQDNPRRMLSGVTE